MADEAFALSPINARAALPTDADYDAIHEAFMETSRGRWFLTEYAKRNRNADTRMVLDAIERIEASLAAQRHAQAEADAKAEARAQAEAQARARTEADARAQSDAQAVSTPKIDLWPELARAFTRARVEIAQRLIRESNEDAFETIRASAETLKSISWALRERGFDSRICDFLDIQVNKITDGYTGLIAESSVAGETEAEILATFDSLIDHVEGLTSAGDERTDALDVMVDAVADAMSEDDPTPVMPLADDDAGAIASLRDELLDATVAVEGAIADVAADEPVATEAPPAEIATAEPVPSAFATDQDAAFHEIYGDDSDIEIVDAAVVDEPAPAVPTEPEINKQRLYEAKLEPFRPVAAALDAHAQAIAAADIEIVDVVNAQAESAPSNPLPVDEPTLHAAEMTAAPSADPPGEKSASLGHALIASGVIQHPTSRPDPLAPFRRLSQAEKVALFT
jgi:hypothetical protein